MAVSDWSSTAPLNAKIEGYTIGDGLGADAHTRAIQEIMATLAGGGGFSALTVTGTATINDDLLIQGSRPTCVLDSTGSFDAIVDFRDDDSRRAYALWDRDLNHFDIAAFDVDGTTQAAMLRLDGNSDTATIRTAGTDRVTVGSGGVVTSAGRIDADAGVSFDSGTNTLDQYEEGTFTPVVADAATGGNTATGTFTGQYERIGNRVFVDIRLLNIDTTGMTAANDLYIRSLPFSSDAGFETVGAMYATQLTITGTLVPFVGSALSYIRLIETQSASGADFTTVGEVNSGTTGIRITMHYEVSN